MINKLQLNGLSAAEIALAYSLILYQASGLGARYYIAIANSFPNLKEFFELDALALKEMGLKSATIKSLHYPDWHTIEFLLNWAKQPNQGIITWGDERYPTLLSKIDDPPPIIYFRGNFSLINLPQLAMVGSRNPTYHGKEIAYAFAAELAARGLVITSGLALGIDGQCHQGALSVQGKTIAVLGTGLDRIYPVQHASLMKQIEETGLVISEFAPSLPPVAHHFPRRNRIISGLSQGVFVVEAAAQSGSLITARFALEQGRDLFALPGSIHSSLSKGCHHLIRQGAKLVETIEDILEELQGYSTLTATSFSNLASPQIDLTDEQNLLLACIDYQATSVDKIKQRCDWSVDKILGHLVTLELLKLIIAQPGGYARI